MSRLAGMAVAPQRSLAVNLRIQQTCDARLPPPAGADAAWKAENTSADSSPTQAKEAWVGHPGTRSDELASGSVSLFLPNSHTQA